MKRLTCGIFALCLTACQTPDPEANVSTTVFQDKNKTPYEDLLKKNWRATTVYSHYETLYVLNAVSFSDGFLTAFERSESERFHSMTLLKDVRVDTTFFVSIFSPHEEYNDLTNDKLWEFVLTIEGKDYKAKSVKKIKEKDAWAPFFHFVNRWSSDFLISFDRPDADKIQEGTLKLALINAQAKTVMEW